MAKQQLSGPDPAEISGSYSESVAREGTKQKVIDALAAKISVPKSEVNPWLILAFFTAFLIALKVYSDKAA